MNNETENGDRIRVGGPNRNGALTVRLPVRAG